MSVLLTGANGFLGKNISSEFIRNGIRLIQTSRMGDSRSIACDLNSKKAVENLINLVEPSMIIHCAAFVPKKIKDYENLEFSSLNVEMLKNILELSKVPLIYISSMTVYGDSKKVVRCELDAGNPKSSYGLSKYECESLLKEDGRDSLAIRIPGLFGEGRGDGLINNIIMNHGKISGESLPHYPILWAAMDVRDASRVIVELAKNYIFDGFMAINVGYDEIYSINRLIKIFENIYSVSIEYKVKNPDFRFDLTLLKENKIISNGSLRKGLINLINKHE